MSIRQVRRYETPWGVGSVWVSDGRLVAVELPAAAGVLETDEEPQAVVDRSSGPAADPGAAGLADQAALERWAAELEAYFRGERLSWPLDEIPLDALSPSPFERAVYEALLSIPPGATVAYGELAETAGYPRAARAVGSVMARNPIPIVIPCHRVVRSDGTLGNYGDDPAWKGRLLAHERAAVRAPLEAEE